MSLVLCIVLGPVAGIIYLGQHKEVLCWFGWKEAQEISKYISSRARVFRVEGHFTQIGQSMCY